MIKILVYPVESRTWNGEKKTSTALGLFQLFESNSAEFHGCSFSTYILQIVLFIQVFLGCIFSVAERNDPLFVCSFLQHFCLSEVRINIHLFISR